MSEDGRATSKTTAGLPAVVQLFLTRRPLEPVVVMRRADSRVTSRFRHEALIVYFYAEVARVVVGDHLPGIARRAKEPPDKLVLAELIGPGHFDHSIDGLSKSNIRYRRRDIIRNHRLHQDRG